MQPGSRRSSGTDADGVTPGVARVRFKCRPVLVFVSVMAQVGGRRMLVLVRRRAVVVLRMIVAHVLVHVQRGSRHGRDGDTLGERKYEQPAHGGQFTRRLDGPAAAAANYSSAPGV